MRPSRDQLQGGLQLTGPQPAAPELTALVLALRHSLTEALAKEYAVIA